MDKLPLQYRILGIDPGTNLLGYAVLEYRMGTLSVPEMGVLQLGKFPRHEDRLRRIFERITLIISANQPQEMAIEAPFYGKNAQSMLKLGRAQGVAIAAAAVKDLNITEYSPKRIKQSITGNGNAAKEQVSAMLEQTLKIDLSEYALDATDALATALCHHYALRSPLGAGNKKKSWGDFIKDNPGRVKK